MKSEKWTEEETIAMQADPFEGDFGGEEVPLGDTIAVARKDAECLHCMGPIRPGDRVRVRREINEDGRPVAYRWCPACVHALYLYERTNAHPDTDEGDVAYEADQLAWELRDPRNAAALELCK